MEGASSLPVSISARSIGPDSGQDSRQGKHLSVRRRSHLVLRFLQKSVRTSGGQACITIASSSSISRISGRQYCLFHCGPVLNAAEVCQLRMLLRLPNDLQSKRKESEQSMSQRAYVLFAVLVAISCLTPTAHAQAQTAKVDITFNGRVVTGQTQVERQKHD